MVAANTIVIILLVLIDATVIKVLELPMTKKNV